MKRRHPSQVLLDADEVQRANRVTVAHYLNKFPAEVDRMPAGDVQDVLHVIWAENQT